MQGNFRNSSRAIGIAVAGAVCGLLALAARGQTPPPYTLTQVGLTGSGYEFPINGGTHHLSVTRQLNAAGLVMGYTERYASTSAGLGQDAWLFTGSATQRVGLNGSGYEYSTYYGPYRDSTPVQMNTAGHVAGYASRFSSGGYPLGDDAWVYAGSATQVIGLTGEGYEYNNGVGIFRFGRASLLNAAGHVVGKTRRHNALGSGFGEDVWFYNGSTTQLIGLTGSGYEYTHVGSNTRVGLPLQLNATGQVVGLTLRYAASGNSLGQDAWLFDGSSTRVIGLSGAGYEYASSEGTRRWGVPRQINDAGQIAGYSRRYAPTGGDLGNDSWLYADSSWKIIGLTGSGYEYANAGGMKRESTLIDLTPAGQVRGHSVRYNASGGELGFDAWMYDGTSTQFVGLTGGVYEYAYTGTGGGMYRHGSAYPLNNVGQVAGYNYRYTATGGRLGTDVWLYTGSETKLIGLTGDGYEYSTSGGTYRTGTPSELNDAGQVAGETRRYSASGDSLGLAGWFYDDDTSTITALQFSFRSSDNYSFTRPELLTDTGVVLGTYELFSGTTDLGSRAFWWSTDVGFYDLGGLVEGGLSAAGWQYLADVYGSVVPGALGATPGGAPLYIVGTGLTIGQTSGESTYLLTAVPEPPSLALLAIGALSALRSRRRTDCSPI